MRDSEGLLHEIEELTLRLRESEETLEAIRSGAVDALVVAAPGGEAQLFTLEGADHVYRTFLESIAEGALTLSGQGVVLYANDAADRLLTRRKSSLLGEHLRSSVRKDHRERFDALFERARHQQSGAEIRLRGPAGGRPVHLSLRPLDGSADEIVTGIVTDLTERKKTEKTLEAERLASSILDQTSEAIVVCDTKGVIIRASRTVRSLVGGDPLLRVRAEVLPLRTADGRAWLLESGDRFKPVKGLEVEVDEAGGSVRHLIMNVDPLSTRREGFIGSVMTLTDITDRKQIEEDLRKQTERFRLLFENSRDSISIQDRDLRYEWVVNPALGLNPDDLIGKTDADIVDAEQFEALRALKERVMESGEELQLEVPLTDPLGIATIWEGTYAPRRDDKGNVTGVYSYFKDVTERRQAEEEARRADAESTAEAERSRLARDLHDSVTQALFAASLKAEALTVEGEVSGKARDVVDELARLTRGALAQMRTMLLELRGEPVEDVPIRQLLRTAAEATEGRSSARVSLTTDGDAELPKALHVAVYRITQEALNNVAKHARAENAWVRLDLGQSLVRLVVGDDGCGYEPSGVDPSHMGLSSMRERAQEAGAELVINTTLGEGTVLRMTWQRPA